MHALQAETLMTCEIDGVQYLAVSIYGGDIPGRLRVYKKLPKENFFDCVVYTGEYADIITAKKSIDLKDKSKIIFPEFLIKRTTD